MSVPRRNFVVGNEKIEVELYEVPADLKQEVYNYVADRLKAAVSIKDKLECYQAIDDLTNETVEYFDQKEYESEAAKNKTLKMVSEVCDNIVSDEVRRLIIEEKIRPDGRGLNEIRPLDAQIDILPRVHGSLIYQRTDSGIISYYFRGIKTIRLLMI